MLLFLVLLFIGVPVLEIYLLIQMGGVIGLGWTLAVCVGTGVIGAYLSRRQGANALAQIRAKAAAGTIPALEMFHALMIVVAGTLLMTPGYVTDAVGLLLLIPPVRTAVAGLARSMFEKAALATPMGNAGFHVYRSRGSGARPGAPSRPDRQAQPEVELLPPEVAPRQPGTRPPKIIDIE